MATIFGAIEDLVLLEGAIAGFGSERDNSIAGNELANILAGGGGLDTLAGGAGDDTYYAELDDTIVEAPGGGTDTVVVTTDYTLGDELENLTLADFDAVRGTGNTANNVIIGSLADNRLFGLGGADALIDDAGDDFLDGGEGADTMSAGAGNDVYIVDHAGDLVAEAEPFNGIDLVEASVTHALSADVENLTLTGATGLKRSTAPATSSTTSSSATQARTCCEGSTATTPSPATKATIRSRAATASTSSWPARATMPSPAARTTTCSTAASAPT